MLQLIDGYRTFRSGPVETPALRGVSVQMEPGTKLALTGPSGSGKSSLLKCMALLDQLDQGSLLLDGSSISHLSENDKAYIRGNTFGFIFQHSHLIPVLTLMENVLLPIGIMRGKLRPAKERAEFLLRRLGLAELARKDVRLLSGGQRQRVAIARALIHPVKYIFADEPTAHLDTETGRKVLELLFELSQSEKVAVLLCTHDPRHTAVMDRVISLQDGRVVAQRSQGEGEL